MTDPKRKVDARVAEYVARRLARGDITSIPAIEPPSDAGRRLISELVPQLFRGVRVQPRQPPPRGIEDNITRLREHCDPLSGIDETTIKDMRAALAPIPKLADTLLSTPAEQPFAPFGKEDATVLAAARWFKHEYFRWVDPIKCPACGGATAYRAQATPNAEDLAGGAGRVEVHACNDAQCGAQMRFPRYNKVPALMRAREGRCGEFAQLFYIFLVVLGIEARYVWNSEDHVWTEYWSPAAKHWVHVDSCEAESGKPLLYDRGWGKVQKWCLAFGPYGAEDVSRAYVDDWDACLARRMQATEDGRGVSEERLKTILLTTTVQCRGYLPDEERARLAEMDAQQRAWIADEGRRDAEAERAGLKGKGRESGTKEWVEARGEGGDGQGESEKDGEDKEAEGVEAKA